VGRREKKYRRIDIYIYKHRLKVGLKKQGDNWSNRSLLSEFWAPGEGPWMLSKLSRTTTCGFCAVDDSGLFAPRMVAIMPNGVDIGFVRHFLSPEIPLFLDGISLLSSVSNRHFSGETPWISTHFQAQFMVHSPTLVPHQLKASSGEVHVIASIAT